MASASCDSEVQVGPQFTLDLRKFIYQLNASSPSKSVKQRLPIARDFNPCSSDRLSNGLKVKGKFGGVGNIHFHYQTLRHHDGEFTLNRILSTPRKTQQVKFTNHSIKEHKISRRKIDNAQDLKNKAHLLLAGKDKMKLYNNSFIMNRAKSNRRGYRVKSREYISTFALDIE